MRIPAAPDEIDATWLTSALRAGGSIREATVASFETAPLDEEGLFGQLTRLIVRYDFEETGAPRSMVLKLSSANPDMRQRANTILCYQREVRFYQQIARQTSLRTPRCFYADVDTDTGLHVLLLEDLAPARSGSALADCSFEHAELSIREIAHFHAAWWETPQLTRLNWLIDVDPDPDVLSDAHDQWWPVFLERAGHQLPDPIIEIGARLGAHRGRIARALTLSPPRTLVHWDFKLENMLFGTAEGGANLAVIDWQLMRRGRGVFDVAYFMSQSLDTPLRRSIEADLLRAYHQILGADGVENYSFEQCLDDYRLALLARFGALISTIAAMPFSEEQIQMHIEVLLPRNIAAILDHEAGALLE